MGSVDSGFIAHQRQAHLLSLRTGWHLEGQSLLCQQGSRCQRIKDTEKKKIQLIQRHILWHEIDMLLPYRNLQASLRKDSPVGSKQQQTQIQEFFSCSFLCQIFIYSFRMVFIDRLLRACQAMIKVLGNKAPAIPCSMEFTSQQGISLISKQVNKQDVPPICATQKAEQRMSCGMTSG